MSINFRVNDSETLAIPNDYLTFIFNTFSQDKYNVELVIGWIKQYGFDNVKKWINDLPEPKNIYDMPPFSGIALSVLKDYENVHIKLGALESDGQKCRRCGGVSISYITFQARSGDEAMKTTGKCMDCNYTFNI